VLSEVRKRERGVGVGPRGDNRAKKKGKKPPLRLYRKSHLRGMSKIPNGGKSGEVQISSKDRIGSRKRKDVGNRWREKSGVPGGSHLVSKEDAEEEARNPDGAGKAIQLPGLKRELLGREGGRQPWPEGDKSADRASREASHGIGGKCESWLEGEGSDSS